MRNVAVAKAMAVVVTLAQVPLLRLPAPLLSLLLSLLFSLLLSLLLSFLVLVLVPDKAAAN